MRFYILPEDRGQMIDVAYAYAHDGTAYKVVTDRSELPGSPEREVWYRGDLDWDREPEHVDENRAPCVDEWQRCAPLDGERADGTPVSPWDEPESAPPSESPEWDDGCMGGRDQFEGS